MSPRATAANVAWLAASLPAHRRFTRALADPAATQDRWLRAHLARQAATAYGRAHGIRELRTYEDFAARVPITAYDDLAPWIERIRQGETGVLTADPVTRLLPTSGSTGARKLIPFTAALQRDFNTAIGAWLVDLNRQHPGLAFGPAYWSVTPLDAATPQEVSAVPIGFDDDSRYLGGVRAWLINGAMAVPSAVRHYGDGPAFRRAVLLHLLAQPDLRLISVWHPSFLALLLETLETDWDDLLTTLDRRDRRRTRQLRHATPSQPATIWPALRVVSCWTDGHAAGPAAALAARLPGVALQAKGLLATEAFVTLPFAGAHPLAICSHFFEFADDDGRIHPAAALRLHQTYEVIVTTAGGLWRYRLGDRVEVNGFIGRTPSLRFIGRGGSVSDRCGEKLAEPFVASVLARQCGAAPFAMLAPAPDGPVWRYVLYLEPGAIGTVPDADACDKALQANPNYALCRHLGQLGTLQIVVLADSGYPRYAAAETARGRRLGDIKPIALSPHVDWARHFTPAGTSFE